MADNISISLQEGSRNEISEIRVDGVIDTLTAGQLEEVIDALLKRERYRIVVDLAGVDYISSAGWGIFISHIRDVRANDGDIKLANMVANVYEIYDLLEFDNVLKAYQSVDAARSDFEETFPGDEKKKDHKLTRVTVVEADEVRQGACFSPGTSPVGSEPTDLQTAVLNLVREDPFFSIREMASELNSLPAGFRASWWQVFLVLKRRRLLSKRSRFKFIRVRR